MDNFIWGVVATSLFTLIGLVWRNLQSEIMEIKARKEIHRDKIQKLESDMKIMESSHINIERRHEDNRTYLKERFDQLEELITLKVDQAYNKNQTRSNPNR